MAERVIQKSLAGRQDILFGHGQVNQTRAGGLYPINKVSMVWACETHAELLTLDTTQFTQATVSYQGAVTHWGWTGTHWYCQETDLTLIGSFEAGFTYTAANQVGCTHSDIYSWSGNLPHAVTLGTDPSTIGSGYVLRSDAILRNELAASESLISIAGDTASAIKRKANKVIYASEYGFNGSTTDFKSLLKQFMAESKNKVIDVNIYTSGVAAVADNTSVTRHNSAVIYALADVTLDTDAAVSNQGQILEAGNNTTFTGVKIDGLGLKGNGILNNGKTGVTVQLCDLSNGLGQGIHDFGGINSKYYDNDIYKCLHGVQLWLSKTARIRGNHIRQVVGGIWSAVATDVLAWGNIVHDCEDVGIDWEGGIDCHSFSNTLWSCAHGELAIFATGPELVSAGIQMGNLSHCHNKIRRVATFMNRSGSTVQNDIDDVGSICVYGIDAAMSGPVEVKYNTVHVESSTATIPGALNAIHTRAVPNQSTHYLEICNNDVVTAHSNAFRLQELNKLNFSNNSFTFRGVNPTRHEIKNIHSGRINKNTFVFDGVNPPSELLYLYTDKAMRGGLSITKNDFSSAGETAIAVDQYISGRAVTLIDNMLPKSATGGVTCNNGLLRYVSQKLLFSVGDNGSFDVRNVSAVYKSSSIGMGSVSMQMGSVGPLYRIAVQTNDIQSNAILSAIDAGGAYNTGIFPNAARRVDFTSTSLTLVDSDGATENSAAIELTMTPRF